MRLFTGFDLPERERMALASLLERFRPLAPLRWSVVDNLHVTTKFIGEWPTERLDELKAALAEVPSPGTPLTLSLDGLGWFPNPHQPRIFWAAVKAGPELEGYAAAIETLLEERLGIKRENRPYRPHLTLARINSPADLAALRRAVAALPSTSFGSFSPGAHYLYLSEAGRYTKLASYAIGNEEAGTQ